jgi:CRISPR-associated endonuclease/helicase Cas3
LDADVLISALAPISSLVQRFGRANRHPGRRKADERGLLFVYPPEKEAPYAAADFQSARQFIDQLKGILEPSQRDLSDKLEQLSPQERAVQGIAGFLSGGYYAVAAGFRDDDGFSCSAVLDTEVPIVLAALNSKPKQAIDGFIIPAPYYMTRSYPGLPPYLRVVDASLYDSNLGLLVDRVSP